MPVKVPPQPTIRTMLLTTFERYFIEGDEQGITADVWQEIMAQYEELTGDKGGSDMVYNLSKYSALTLRRNNQEAILWAVEYCAQNGCYAPKLCEILRGEFAPKQFSNTPELFEDIQWARSTMKRLDMQIEEAAELLQQEQGDWVKETYFDEVLAAYEITFKAAPNKETMTVQQFAIRYNKLKQRITNETPVIED